ncbi:MAG: SMI1/KNR4 family protein [Candidatus Sericytochromatia bacterium]
MKPLFKNSFSLISDKELERVERKLKITLPESYRRFLLEINGGGPKPNHFETEKSLGSEIFLYGITPHEEPISSEYGDLLLENMNNVLEMPVGMITIASNIFGDEIFLSVSGPDNGSLYWWMHDHPDYSDEYGRPRRENLALIASDFEAFINSFCVDPDMEEEEEEEES